LPDLAISRPVAPQRDRLNMPYRNLLFRTPTCHTKTAWTCHARPEPDIPQLIIPWPPCPNGTDLARPRRALTASTKHASPFTPEQTMTALTRLTSPWRNWPCPTSPWPPWPAKP